MGATLIWDDDSTSLTFEVVKAYRNKSTSKVTKFGVQRGAAITDHVRPEPAVPGLTVLVSNTPLRPGTPKSVALPVPIRVQSASSLDVVAEKYQRPPGLTPGGLAVAAVDAIGGLIFGEEGPEYTIVSSKFDAKLLDVSYAGRKVDTGKVDRRIELYETLEGLRLDAKVLKVLTPMALYTDCVIESLTFDKSKSGSGLELDLEFSRVRIVDTKTVPAPVVRVKRAEVKSPKGDPGEASLSAEERKSLLSKIVKGFLK